MPTGTQSVRRSAWSFGRPQSWKYFGPCHAQRSRPGAKESPYQRSSMAPNCVRIGLMSQCIGGARSTASEAPMRAGARYPPHRMRARAAVVLAIAGLVSACGDEGQVRPTPTPPEPERPLALERYRTAWDAAERAAAISEGREVIGRLECTRCHVVDD